MLTKSMNGKTKG